MNGAKRLWQGGLLLGMMWLAACSAGGEGEGVEPSAPVAAEAAPEGGEAGAVEASAPPADYASVHGGRDFAADVELAPNPEATARPLRRLSVKQLREAIANATGGLAWHDETGRDMLTLLSPTLGVPTYIDTTNEDLEASLVFQKFLGDGVRSVCSEAIQNDMEMAVSDRVLLRYADPTWVWEQASAEQQGIMDRNLRYMSLRITGRAIAAEDEEGLSRLRWLMRSVTHATGDPAKGWRAVCVGLMSSPEFYLY